MLVLSHCLGLTRKGGTVLVNGMADEGADAAVSPKRVFSRELTIKGSFARTHSCDSALLELRTSRVQTGGIVTHELLLDEMARALATGAPGWVKSVVRPNAV